MELLIVWFLLSAVLSPLLGFVFCIASKDLSRSGATMEPTDATHRKCPKCAEFIKPEATVCKHCGAQLEPDRDFVTRKTNEREALKDEENSNAILGWSIIGGVGLLIYFFSR